MANPLPITSVITGLLAIAQVPLTVLVSYLRGKTGIQFLDGGNETLLRRIRAQSQVPVLMLTAKGDDVDRIVGLELGADDYVPKPCTPRELVARLRAILRRTQEAA